MRNIIRMVFVLTLMPLAIAAGADAASAKSGTTTLRQDVYCLAQNIYHEARGEPMEGKIAVGHVVLNRMADKRYPGLACSVIRQGGEKRRHRCQFSWWCDGRSDQARNRTAWQESLVLAYLIKAGVTPDPTGGALWYHATYVEPSWAKRLTRHVQIGKHIFYTDPRRTARKKTAVRATQVADAGSE